MAWLRTKLFLLKMYLTKPHVMQVRYIHKGVKYLVIIERKPFGMEIVGRYTVLSQFKTDPEHSKEAIPFQGQNLP